LNEIAAADVPLLAIGVSLAEAAVGIPFYGWSENSPVLMLFFKVISIKVMARRPGLLQDL
jgi:hypothetical protein